jgi:hypothetical protein
LAISNACGEKATSVSQRELSAASGNEISVFLDETQIAAAYLQLSCLSSCRWQQVREVRRVTRIVSHALAGMLVVSLANLPLEREASEGE